MHKSLSFCPSLLSCKVLFALLLLLATPVLHASTTGTLGQRILAAAREEAERQTPYIMNYEVLKYPGGDVSEGTGVCTDLVVRALRAVDIDLQQEIQRDKKSRPSAYPTQLWDVKKPDPNIDHRRCPNLVSWLRRHAEELPATLDAEPLTDTWQPGDIVFYVHKGATHPWHVGIVSDRIAPDGMPMIVDSFPPHTSESHRLDDFAPVHSHFRMRE